MCDVCFALYGLRPRERTASEGRPTRGRRLFRASAEVPGGVSDDGASGGERALEGSAVADEVANPRPPARRAPGESASDPSRGA
jgi:hypothetical protein